MTEETKTPEGAPAGVSDSTQLLAETLERLKLHEYTRERAEWWKWRSEEILYRRITIACVVAECIALVVIAFFALRIHG